MFKNYLLTAVRNLRKNKVFSGINIMGLALGLACSLLIMLWVNDEYNVDAFFKNGNQLYNIYERQYTNGQISCFYGGPGVMADEMKRVLPDVQYASNFAWNELRTFEVNNKIIKENGNHASPDFFKMFSYTLLAGKAETALQTPGDIAISKKMAIAFFGSPAQAIGKTVRYENKEDFRVTAVFDDMPKNSTMQFDYLLSWQHFLQGNGWAKDWTNNGPATFIMLRKGANAKTFEAGINRFLDKYNNEQNKYSYIRLGMTRYSDVYLHGSFDKAGNVHGGRIEYVRLFSIVAIFILLIGCINFMNLTTARSIKRAKEIGIRKVAGAVRFALIRQFIGEALFIVTMAVIISLLLLTLVLPRFNTLTGKNIQIPFGNAYFWLAIAGLLLVTGFVSGSYPALYLSSFKPAKVLKGLPKFSATAQYFRKGLVVFQFVLSIVLIVGTIVIKQQVDYVQNANLGYDRENLLYIPLEGDLTLKYALFKTQAMAAPGIKEVSRITDVPTQIDNGTGGVQWDGRDPNDHRDFTQTAVGYDFTKTMHVQMAQGRDFSKNYATDSVGYLINETALGFMGYKDPIGKPLTFWGTKGTIIGVMKDFHFNSMHTKINPLVIRLGESYNWGTALVRTEPGKTKQALASLEKICSTLNPKFPFSYKFSDEEYAKLYQSEQVISKLAWYFAVLAIFISCLGLLGLVMFTAEQRTKEFGIRKVLGASPARLFGLLSKEFVLLVGIAMFIAAPLAWLAMHDWLKGYEYHINITWWMFVVAGILAIAIALLTISYQAIKASVANPVKSLRTE
ncbi:MAG TPA: ABC transporter permease [Chitinophagaceae bacterium]|nr:ABC transporter permease [Chitinophagaceae bacterium]